MYFKFSELTARQQAQAREMFLDAGTARDDFWYETFGVPPDVVCRTRLPDDGTDECLEDGDASHLG